MCVCCSGLPCPSCSSLRSCRTIFSYLFFIVFRWPCYLHWRSQQSPSSAVAFPVPIYINRYIYIYIVGIRIRIYLQELPDGQRFNFLFLARNLYLCICLLVYCAAARQLCLLYLRSIEARNSILKHPNQAQT